MASIEDPKTKKQAWADNMKSLLGPSSPNLIEELNQSRLINTLQQKPIPTIGTIQASPEPSIRDAFDRARFANTPLQKLDAFVGTLRDTTIYHARKLLGAELDKSLTSLPADTMKMFTWVFSGDLARPGDRQFSEGVAKSVEHYFENKSKPMGYGEYDISMAVGWMPRDPIRVNGVDNVKLDKPISNLFAVMIRNKDGSIEILDPSVKLEADGFLKAVGGAVAKLPTIPFVLNDSYTDKRWKETAGTYVVGQLLPTVLSGVTLGAAKGLGSASKAEVMQRVAENAKTLGKMEGVYGISQLGYMGVTIAAGKYQTMLNQTATRDLAGNIMDAMQDPKKLTVEKIATLLNDGLNSHTRNGSGSRHVYIPSLGKGDSPWERFSQVLQGRIDGYSRPNNPWEEWKSTKCYLSQMSSELKGNPKFMASFYGLAEKAMAGKELSDQESLMLRVGSAIILGAKVDIAGKKFTADSMEYTKEEKAGAVEILRASMLTDLAENIDHMPAMAKRMDVDLERRKSDTHYVLTSSEKLYDATDADLLTMIKQKSLEYTSQSKGLGKVQPSIQNRMDNSPVPG